MNERNRASGFSAVLRTILHCMKFAISEGRKMSNTAENVKDMGYVPLFLDSMVPKKDRSIWNFFNYNSSDPDALVTEIDKYKDFYDEMVEAMHTVRNGDLDILEELVDDLCEKVRDAEFGVESTDSRTLRKVYQDFLSKQEKMENMIRTIESEGQKHKELNRKWDESIHTAGTAATGDGAATMLTGQKSPCLQPANSSHLSV